MDDTGVSDSFLLGRGRGWSSLHAEEIAARSSSDLCICRLTNSTMDGVLGTEREPLVKRKDFRRLAQPAAEQVVVQCCCVESSRLGRVPIIRTLFKKKDPSEKVCRDWIAKCSLRNCIHASIKIPVDFRVLFLLRLACCCPCWDQW